MNVNVLVSEQMSDCCLTPSEQIFNYIVVTTSFISMRWWCTRCTWPTHQVFI